VDWIHLAGCCERINETSGSMKGGEIFWPSEWLSASQRLRSVELVDLRLVNRVLFIIQWHLLARI
jgi:hypothetical protein